MYRHHEAPIIIWSIVDNIRADVYSDILIVDCVPGVSVGSWHVPRGSSCWKSKISGGRDRESAESVQHFQFSSSINNLLHCPDCSHCSLCCFYAGKSVSHCRNPYKGRCFLFTESEKQLIFQKKMYLLPWTVHLSVEFLLFTGLMITICVSLFKVATVPGHVLYR